MNNTPTPLGSDPQYPQQPDHQPAGSAPVQYQQFAPPSESHSPMPQPAAPYNTPQPGYPVPPGYPGYAPQPGAPSTPFYAPGMAPAMGQPGIYPIAGASPQPGYGFSAVASMPFAGAPATSIWMAVQSDERGILALAGLFASIGSVVGLMLGVLLAVFGHDTVGGGLIIAVTPLAIVAIVLSAMGRGSAKRRGVGTAGLVVAIIALILLLIVYTLVVIGLTLAGS